MFDFNLSKTKTNIEQTNKLLRIIKRTLNDLNNSKQQNVYTMYIYHSFYSNFNRLHIGLSSVHEQIKKKKFVSFISSIKCERVNEITNTK